MDKKITKAYKVTIQIYRCYSNGEKPPHRFTWSRCYLCLQDAEQWVKKYTDKIVLDGKLTPAQYKWQEPIIDIVCFKIY